MYLPRPVKKTLEQIEQNGYTAYVVGGCVRDFVMGRYPLDYDIATSALPEQIKQIFFNEVISTVGEKYGTIVICVDGSNLEVTTFRHDDKYLDGRRPSRVNFTLSLENDLSRRDFTINAMAFSEHTGIVDVFGGKADIDLKIIKTVGSPMERLVEDKLRILRALRFSSVLNFSLDTQLSLAINKLSQCIRNVSKERITVEFLKLLMGEISGNVIFEYKEVFVNIFQNAKITKKIVLLNCLPKNDLVRLSAFAELSQLEVKDLQLNLRLSREQLRRLSAVFSSAYVLYDFSRYELRNMLSVLDVDVVYAKVVLSGIVNKMDISKSLILLDSIVENIDYVTLPKLAVSGQDIIELGFNGKMVGIVLQRLLKLVNNEILQNDKDVIIEFVKKNMDI